MNSDQILVTPIEAAVVFDALAHPRRIRILRILRQSKSPLSFGDIQTAMQCSNQVLTHHLKKMEAGSLIERHTKGRYTVFRLTPQMPIKMLRKFSNLLDA